jgi:ATP-binding cassette subfamily C (CFTR/MRP) protein 1
MAPPGPDPEKDGLPAGSPAAGEPRDADLDDKDSVELDISKDESSSARPNSESDEEKRTALAPAQTSATTASAVTEVEAVPKQKPWYKQPNPMRWGKIPPVPTERTVSPEYNAPFLSQVYFQWMAPIMSVRPQVSDMRLLVDMLTRCRLDINGPLRRMISGLSIQTARPSS